QTETEATGAPQKHHYTLNQQVGSITRLNSSLIERQVYQGGQQPRLLDAEYSSALANTTTDGIHWLNANKVL
ncbi:hypothetical protein NXH16_28945, partial [Klebsiella pneumoniae]|nr:hypothetical protein [Klebsiella pneumoniae]MDS7701237.1 hypothetical protein [Klebsiella pneumoniae]